MASKTTGNRRINREKNKEEIIGALTNPELGIFKEIWRLLLFAAQIGIENSRRDPLREIDSGKGIDQSTFGNSPVWPGILYLMGVTESGDSSELSNADYNEEARVQRFEEYANGGLAIIEDFMSGRIIDLDSLLIFIDSQSINMNREADLDFTI